ncbi:receptor-like protein kinase HSL1-like, partial [Trifolium medium]|nr:receptor-like protein kinase HSL1-like [Trifolium medium]
MTMMLYNEETIGNNKVVEVKKLGKNRHKRISRLWCCYKSDNMFLVYEYISNESLMDTLNGKKSLLDWNYSYSSFIVIDAAEGLVYLHHNCVLSIVHKHMRSNKVLSGVFEGKVAGTGASKMVPFVSKVVVFMYVSMVYVTLVKRRKRKKWDPGGHLDRYTSTRSSQCKQWDPGKICAWSNFREWV